MFERAGQKHNDKFQLWQPESHPIELNTAEMANQKTGLYPLQSRRSRFCNQRRRLVIQQRNRL